MRRHRLLLVPCICTARPLCAAPWTSATDCYENPRSKGVNLEAFVGRDGFYTARVTRKIRLLLRERQDEEGTYLKIVRFGDHDDTY